MTGPGWALLFRRHTSDGMRRCCGRVSCGGAIIDGLRRAGWASCGRTRGDAGPLAVGGVDENAQLKSDFQTFDSTAANGAGAWSAQQSSAEFFPTYPALHLLADGRYLYSGVATFSVGNVAPGIWDSATNTYTPVT